MERLPAPLGRIGDSALLLEGSIGIAGDLVPLVDDSPVEDPPAEDPRAPALAVGLTEPYSLPLAELLPLGSGPVGVA